MNISPPWMSGSKEINKQPMLVVHMNDDELEGLDNLQGGPSIDPDTGLREYSALAEVIEIPEIRKLFHDITDQIEANDGHVPENIMKIYNSAKKHGLPYVETPEEKHDPLKSLEHTGRGGDTKLALIPMNLALLLIELRHEPSINPKTGLLEFKKRRGIKGFFKKIIPTVLTVGGGILGTIIAPGIGTSIGAGLGNTAGQLATGRNLKTSAMRGLKIGALAYGAQGLGQAAGLSGSTPYTGGFFGGSPNMLAQGLGKFGMGSAPAHASTMPPGQLVSSPKGWLQMTPSGKYIPAQMAGSGSGGFLNGLGNLAGSAGGLFGGGNQQTGMSSGNDYGAQGGFLDGILGNGGLLKNVLGPAGVAALTYKGAKKDEKKAREYQREQQAREDRMREQLGFNRSFTPYRTLNRRVNPRFHERDELKREYGVLDEPYYIYDNAPGYATGGAVKRGMGGGVKRAIHQMVGYAANEELQKSDLPKKVEVEKIWQPIPTYNRKINPRFYENLINHDPIEREHGFLRESPFIYELLKKAGSTNKKEDEEDERGYSRGGYVKSYNKGTLVRGPGKGQDDKIKTSIPSGSYIIDASSTSMFGDGSTKAGAEVLKKFEDHIKRKFPKHFMKEVERTVSHQSEIVPVWLSEGEYKFDPVTVTALGKGSNTKGASILKDMVIKLRKHKNSRGTSLPPKAKDPNYYIGER